MTDTLWVAVGFLIFIGVVVYAGGHKMLLSGIELKGARRRPWYEEPSAHGASGK